MALNGLDLAAVALVCWLAPRILKWGYTPSVTARRKTVATTTPGNGSGAEVER